MVAEGETENRDPSSVGEADDFDLSVPVVPSSSGSESADDQDDGGARSAVKAERPESQCFWDSDEDDEASGGRRGSTVDSLGATRRSEHSLSLSPTRRCGVLEESDDENDDGVFMGKFSTNYTGKACSGLNPIVDESETENREPSSVGEADDFGLSVPVVPSSSGSELADDQYDGGARSAVTAERPEYQRFWDSDEDDEASGGRRSSIVDSLGATRRSEHSLSLSPTRRCGVLEESDDEDDDGVFMGKFSTNYTGEACSGLNPIVDEGETENREPSSVGEADDFGLSVPVVPSSSSSESADDQDDGGARSAVTAERPECQRFWDSDEDDEASGGRRNSIVDSLGATRGLEHSLSLSPTRRCGVLEESDDEDDDGVFFMGKFSTNYTGETCSGLNPIVDEGEIKNREPSSVGEADDFGLSVPVVPSSSGSESADDQDDGGARSAVTAERPESQCFWDNDEDDEASGGRRSIIVDSLGATRGSEYSLSLSPTRRCGVLEESDDEDDDGVFMGKFSTNDHDASSGSGFSLSLSPTRRC